MTGWFSVVTGWRLLPFIKESVDKQWFYEKINIFNVLHKNTIGKSTFSCQVEQQ
ncbi:MAG: hypothetical protein IJD04_02010 [Desulfovibrionaceae bacterium]|nr:hypothetical protein [Desulfovibrionaceae bacterium]